MRRWQLAFLAMTVTVLAACEQKNAEPSYTNYEDQTAATQPPPPADGPADPYAGDPLAAPAPLPRPVDSGSEVVADTAPPPPPAAKPVAAQSTGGSGSSGPRMHVVAKGDTFYKLARDYYGTASRWREIWKANRQRVSNPERLPVGTKLIIP